MNMRRISSLFIAGFVAVFLFAHSAGAQIDTVGNDVTFDDAITAFNYGDNDLANRSFLKLANNGDSRAQYYLAYMLDSGLGSAQDVAGASSWYKKSAQQDYLPAIVYMGYMFSSGHGVSKDDKEAFKWYTRAAQMGDAIAQNNLATMLQRGVPYAKNEALAAQWFLQSAMQGNMRAQYNLATMYRLGQGIHKNLPEALRWYSFAANQGDMYAQNALGYMYRKGEGVEKLAADATEEQKKQADIANKQSSIDWYRRAAEQGHMKSQMAIAVMYELGEVPDKGPDDAMVWYFNAAAQGNEKAMHRLGYMYERGPYCSDLKEKDVCPHPEKKGSGVAKDDKEAFKWYKKASDERNYGPSIVALASFYEKGQGVKQDIKKAMELYQKAAGIGEPLAMMELGRLFRDGKGILNKPDNVRALQWYMLASNELRKRVASGKSNLAEEEMLTAAIKSLTELNLRMDSSDKENARRLVQSTRFQPVVNRLPGSKGPSLEYDPIEEDNKP